MSINIKYVPSFEIKFARQIFPAEILIYVKWNTMKWTGLKIIPCRDIESRNIVLLYIENTRARTRGFRIKFYVLP